VGILNKSFSQKKLNPFAVAGLSAAIALAVGCSSSDPDKGSAQSTTSLSGTAIDGYIVGATVYLDLNDNGQRNAGEPSALTDKDGFFTTAKDGTDYCASGVTSALARHCLKASSIGEEVIIRSYGGFDIFTGEPFDGSLSSRISVGVDGIVENKIISPLTSMLTDASESERTQILSAYGLLEDDLDRDFLDAGSFDADTVNAAITFHKVVSLFSEVFDEHYEAIGTENGFPDSANSLIYKELAIQMGNSKLDSTKLGNAYDAAEIAIRDLYTGSDETVPQAIASNRTTTIANAAKILSLVINAMPTNMVFGDAQSRVVAVEMVVKKMIDGAADVDDAISDAEDITTDASNLYANLNGADIDFSALTEVDYSLGPDFNIIDIDLTGAIPLTELADKQLFINHAQDSDGISGSAHFFFSADESGTAGTLDACLKYQDSNDVRVEETEGTLIDGTWFAIDDNRLVLTLEGSFDITLISKGVDNGNAEYSLSYGGETISWLSDNATGLIADGDDGFVSAQPTSNAECVTLLTPPPS